MKVKCYAKPIVGIMSTGDELVEPNIQPTGSKVIFSHHIFFHNISFDFVFCIHSFISLHYQIRDSNRPALLTAFRQDGYDCIDLGIVKDTVEGLRASFLDAVNRCDVVITSGGVSMGDADYVKTLLQELGTV